MEDELLNCLRTDPGKGMRLVMDRYMGLMLQIACSHLQTAGGMDAAKECVYDAFAEFYKSFSSFDPSKGTVKAYLAVIVKRRAVRMYREYEMRCRVGELTEEIPAKDVYGSVETRQVIKEALGRLNEEERKIVMMKYYWGFPTKKIAAEMGLRANTVDKKAQRALEKLRDLLEGRKG